MTAWSQLFFFGFITFGLVPYIANICNDLFRELDCTYNFTKGLALIVFLLFKLVWFLIFGLVVTGWFGFFFVVWFSYFNWFGFTFGFILTDWCGSFLVGWFS